MNPNNLTTSNSFSGPLHYFGNRNLSLPGIEGRMKVDTSWLSESSEIIQYNRNGKKFKRCFEPFAGSAAWTISAIKQEFAEEYYINDCNKVLIDFYIKIKDNPSIVKDSYERLVTQFSTIQDKASFFKSTIEKYNTSNDDQKCLLISFIINHSWAGMVFHDEKGNIIYREPKIQGKAVPGYLNTATLNLTEYFDSINYLSNLFNKNSVHFLCMDFQQALSDIHENDFVNLNPPYPENERSISDKYGLYFEIYSKDDLHTNICAMIKKMDLLNVTYFMSYGLHNPEMKGFLIRNSSNTYRHYLRVIGHENCLFGRWLDQWYFSDNIIVPSNHHSKVIPAHIVLKDNEVSPQDALKIFTTHSVEKFHPIA